MTAFCKNPNCHHEYQDAKYGKKIRVHNPTMKKDGGETVYRCTVCGEIRKQ